MRRSVRWVAGAFAVVLCGGCGLVLGLDEYELATGAHCDDGARNEDESAMDCGGALCRRCGDGAGCVVGTDCESLMCVGGLCRPAACDDAVKNGEETGVDCGGGCPVMCGPDEACVEGGDCAGGVCEGGVCAPTCSDGVKSGEESGVDCGGPDCGGCENGEGCAVAGDCVSGVCKKGACVSYHIWSRRFGDGANQSGESIAIDAAGNVLVAGKMQGSVDFGGGALTSAGGDDVFVVKRDASGNHVWSKRFGDVGSEGAPAIAVDDAGNVFFAITSSGSMSFGGAVLASAGGDDVFIAKLNASGGHIWSKRFGDAKGQTVSGLAVDGSGDVIITGSFDGSVNFGGGVMLNQDGVADLFIASFDGSGAPIWSERYEVSGASASSTFAVDESGNVALAGSFQGTIKLGSSPLISAGQQDVFAAKLDASGKLLWSKQFGDDTAQFGTGVAMDGSGSVLLVGRSQSTIDLGDGVGGLGMFIAKLDASGAHVWSKYAGKSNFLEGASEVASDASGNVLVAGSFVSPVDFGGGPLMVVDSSGPDVFLLKLDGDGNHISSKSFGGQSYQFPGSIAVDDEGDVALTGRFQGAIELGGGELASADAFTYDLFIAKFALP